MTIPLEIRKQIRAALTCNWAGGYQFAKHRSVIVRRTLFPSAIRAGAGHYRFGPGPATEYAVVFGASTDPAADFYAGREIVFWGRIKGTDLPKRMLGQI